MTSPISRRRIFQYGAAAAAASVAAPALGGSAAAAKDSTAGPAKESIAKAARPQLRYWWPGSGVTPKEISAEVHAMADAGFGGFEIADVRNSQHVAMPPATYGWGNPAWKAGVAAALRTAADRGLRVDLTIGPYWPAVVPGVKPDDDAAMKELTYGQAVLAGGSRFHGSVPAPHSAPSGASVGPAVTVTPVLQAVHAAQVSGDTGATPLVLKTSTLTDLTGKVRNGALDWTAPKGGNWVVIASWSRGTAMIEKMPYYEGYLYPFTDPQAYVVDHFGAKGTAAIVGWWENDLLTTEIRRLLKRAGENFFEDSLEFNTELHWTPRMLAEFRGRRGYDLRALLPLVHGQDSPVYTTEDATTGEDVRWDYFQTLSDLFVEHHVEPLDDWARRYGMRFRNQAYGAPVDSALASALTGVPEGESLAFSSTPDSFRLLAAGRDLGRRGVLSSELGAQFNQAYRLTVADLTRVANIGYGLGVNQVRIHGFSYASGPGSRWPGFYAWAPMGVPINFSENWTPRVPQWQMIDDLTGYLARTQTVLQAGTAKVDVAIYRQEFDSTGAQYDGGALTGAGYSYQLVSWGLLGLGTAKVRGRRLDADGPAYRALIVADVARLLPESARRIISYAKSGLPVLIVGVVGTDQKGLASLPHVATAAEVPAALAELGVTPGATGGLLHVARETRGATYHYLHNAGTAAVSTQVTLRGGGVPWRIDAWTGAETRLAVYDARKAGFLTVPVTAAAGEAVLLKVVSGAARHAVSADAALVATARGVSARTTVAGKVSAVLDDGRKVKVSVGAAPAAPVIGGWDVAIEDWRPENSTATGVDAVPTRKIVHQLRLDSLRPWREIDGLAEVSGVGTYTARFVLPPNWRAGATLSLGSVGAGTARVEVNGRKVGPINHLNPVVDLGGLLRAGENTLVVTVASTLINRMRAEEPSAFVQPAQDYGLLGPVTVTPYVETPLG